MVKYPRIYSKFKELAEIPESEWCHLEQYFSPMSFKKNDHIIHAGTSCIFSGISVEAGV